MSIRVVAHAILRLGTPEQKDFFLPRILTGEVFFCQGYSEPESGSDLASLQIFALVRTSRSERKQQGITFVLIDPSY